MVLDLGVSSIPMPVFMAVHLAGLAIGIALAYRAFSRPSGGTLFGVAFSLYALAEVLYMGYHVGVTTFLLSHTLAEALDLVAFLLAGVALAQSAVDRRASSRATVSR